MNDKYCENLIELTPHYVYDTFKNLFDGDIVIANNNDYKKYKLTNTNKWNAISKLIGVGGDSFHTAAAKYMKYSEKPKDKRMFMNFMKKLYSKATTIDTDDFYARKLKGDKFFEYLIQDKDEFVVKLEALKVVIEKELGVDLSEEFCLDANNPISTLVKWLDFSCQKHFDYINKNVANLQNKIKKMKNEGKDEDISDVGSISENDNVEASVVLLNENIGSEILRSIENKYGVNSKLYEFSKDILGKTPLPYVNDLALGEKINYDLLRARAILIYAKHEIQTGNKSESVGNYLNDALYTLENSLPIYKDILIDCCETRIGYYQLIKADLLINGERTKLNRLRNDRNIIEVGGK